MNSDDAFLSDLENHRYKTRFEDDKAEGDKFAPAQAGGFEDALAALQANEADYARTMAPQQEKAPAPTIQQQTGAAVSDAELAAAVRQTALKAQTGSAISDAEMARYQQQVAPPADPELASISRELEAEDQAYMDRMYRLYYGD